MLKDPLELNRNASVDRLPLEPWIRSCPERPTNSGNWSGIENAVVVPAESVMFRVVISRPEESQNRNCKSVLSLEDGLVMDKDVTAPSVLSNGK